MQVYNQSLNQCSFFAGVQNGLQLLVNIEQYEYMKGPHDAVGLKVLLHEQGAVPLVQDFADAVPAGMNTFIGADVTRVSEMVFLCFFSKSTRKNQYFNGHQELLMDRHKHNIYCLIVLVTDLSFSFLDTFKVDVSCSSNIYSFTNTAIHQLY